MNGTALSQRDQGWLERPRERRKGGALGERATCVWGQKVLPYTQLKLASLFGFSCVLALSASLSRTSSPSEHWFPHTCLPLCRSSESQAASRSFSEGGFWGSQLPAYSVPFECAVPWAWSALSHSSSRPPGQMLPLLGSLPVPPLCGPGTGLWPWHPSGEPGSQVYLPNQKISEWGFTGPIVLGQAQRSPSTLAELVNCTPTWLCVR